MIEENVKKILDELTENVELIAAAKTITPEEIKDRSRRKNCRRELYPRIKKGF
jgi:hypothetical protein